VADKLHELKQLRRPKTIRVHMAGHPLSIIITVWNFNYPHNSEGQWGPMWYNVNMSKLITD